MVLRGSLAWCLQVPFFGVLKRVTTWQFGNLPPMDGKNCRQDSPPRVQLMSVAIPRLGAERSLTCLGIPVCESGFMTLLLGTFSSL